MGVSAGVPTKIERSEARMVGGIKATNKLTDRTVRAFVTKAREGQASTRKLSDGGGLYITLTPAGTPVWRLKYRFGGKERLYAVGVYPSVGLEAARAERELVKDHLREGKDPNQARQVKRAENAVSADNTFASVSA